MQNEISSSKLWIEATFLFLPVVLFGVVYFFELPVSQESPVPLGWMRLLFGLMFAADMGVYIFLNARRKAAYSQDKLFGSQSFWSVLLFSLTVSPALYGFFLYLLGDSQVIFLAFCIAAFLATLVVILWETLNPFQKENP